MNRRELFTQGAVSACSNLLGSHPIDRFHEHLRSLQTNSDAMAKKLLVLSKALEENMASIDAQITSLRTRQRQIIGAMVVIVLIG